MTTISFWIGEGCLASGITTLIDAFSIAELWHQALAEEPVPPLFDLEIITNDGAPVTAWGNVKMGGGRSVFDVTETDCMIFSPILPRITPIPDNIRDLARHAEQLREKGAAVATVCTGSFVLAEMGLLDGRRATTNWQHVRLFKKHYPRVDLRPEYMLTEDDNIICTAAATAVYNLALHLIRRYGSQNLASVCAKALLVDPSRISQSPYVMAAPLRNHGDRQVLRAQTIMEEGYADLESVDDLAREVGISPRHFKRRFKQATGELPLKYLQRVRIDAAKKRLETTRESIDKITWAVGYRDVSSFTRLFRQMTDISPRAYREKFYSRVPW